MPVSMMVLAVGATMRLTRLVTKDYLTEQPRRWVQRNSPEKVAYLVGCPWCSSFWIGGVVAVATARWPRSRLVTAAWLALTASHAAGMMANLDADEVFGEPDDGLDAG